MTEQEMQKIMNNIVKGWWEALTKEQKTAVKLLKFSPSVIGSMFFFDNMATSGWATDKYVEMRWTIDEYGKERNDFSCGIDWEDYHKKEQTCRRIEKSIAEQELISKLPVSLKNQVVDNLRRQDECWKECWKSNIYDLKFARRQMFWKAIAELRKSVEG